MGNVSRLRLGTFSPGTGFFFSPPAPQFRTRAAKANAARQFQNTVRSSTCSFLFPPPLSRQASDEPVVVVVGGARQTAGGSKLEGSFFFSFSFPSFFSVRVAQIRVRRWGFFQSPGVGAEVGIFFSLPFLPSTFLYSMFPPTQQNGGRRDGNFFPSPFFSWQPKPSVTY